MIGLNSEGIIRYYNLVLLTITYLNISNDLHSILMIKFPLKKTLVET
jgi:hypothetical protein